MAPSTRTPKHGDRIAYVTETMESLGLAERQGTVTSVNKGRIYVNPDGDRPTWILQSTLVSLRFLDADRQPEEAIQDGPRRSFVEAVNRLVESGMSISAAVKQANKDGKTAFGESTYYGYRKQLGLLPKKSEPAASAPSEDTERVADASPVSAKPPDGPCIRCAVLVATAEGERNVAIRERDEAREAAATATTEMSKCARLCGEIEGRIVGAQLALAADEVFRAEKILADALTLRDDSFIPPWPMSFQRYQQGTSQPEEPGWYLTLDDGHDFPVAREWDPASPWYCRVFAFYPMQRPAPIPCPDCSGLGATIHQQQAKIDELAGERSDALIRIAEMQEEKRNWATGAEACRRDLEAALKARDEAIASFEQTKKRNQELVDEIARANFDRAEAEDATDAARAEIEKLKGELATANSTGDALAGQVVGLQEEVGGLLQKVERLNGPSEPIAAVAYFSGRLSIAAKRARGDLDDALGGARRALGIETVRDKALAAKRVLDFLSEPDEDEELSVGTAVRVTKVGVFCGRIGRVVEIVPDPQGNVDDSVVTVELTNAAGHTLVPLFPADVEVI